MPAIEDYWQQQLDKQLACQGLRVRRVIHATLDRTLQINGRACLDFASNDYLGLSQHSQVIAAAQAALQQWGVGATASQMVGGYRLPQKQLEQAIAHWLGVEAVLVFSSGYLANLGLMMGLISRHDLVIADKACHASLLDGIRLTGAKLKRFAHNQPFHAAQQLLAAVKSAHTARSAGHRVWIVTESIFSMSGDAAPLEELQALAQAHAACLIVDEAHALGVLGAGGRGLVANLTGPKPIITGTFGKAFGTAGAFIAGSQLMIDYLQQTARTCTYSTALPPAITQATLASLQLLQQQPERVMQLQRNIVEFKHRAQSLNLPLLSSDSAIQIIPLQTSERAIALSTALMDLGIWIPAIRPPTVPIGQACLRLVLSAVHTSVQLDYLFAQLKSCRVLWAEKV